MTTLLEEDIETVCKREPFVQPYPDTVPANSDYPCVTYTRIPLIQRNMTHSGRTMGTAKFQFSAWGKTKRESLETAEKIKQKFDLNKTDFEMSYYVDCYGTKETESGNYQTVYLFQIHSNKT